MSKNVMYGALAYAGDKSSALVTALADVCLAASRGWADGDVSIMKNTIEACKKTRTGKAVAEVTQAYADIIRAERVGGRVVLADNAPAWRVQCFLPVLPVLPAELKGKALATKLAETWGLMVAQGWISAVELHAADQKAAADDKRTAAKVAAEATAASVSVTVESAPAAAEFVGPDIPALNDLQSQVDTLTAERDALRQGNKGLSAMVERLKAELLALTPLPAETVPAVAYSDLSVKARAEFDAAILKVTTKKARKAVPA